MGKGVKISIIRKDHKKRYRKRIVNRFRYLNDRLEGHNIYLPTDRYQQRILQALHNRNASHVYRLAVIFINNVLNRNGLGDDHIPVIEL